MRAKNLHFILVAIIFASSCYKPELKSKPLLHKNEIEWIRQHIKTASDFGLTAEIAKLLPNGCAIFYVAKGNINYDKTEDYLIITENHQTEDFRTLYVILSKNDKHYLFAENDSAIGGKYCGGMYGDCFREVVFGPGGFTIEFYGGSGNNKWLLSDQFKYDKAKNEIYLIKVGEAGTKTIGIEHDHKDFDSFVTEKDFGKIRFTEFRYGKNYFVKE